MGQYRQKTCPTCRVTHRKKGDYCSRSCGNHRVHTPKARANLSSKLINHWQTNDMHVRRDQASAAGKLGIRQYRNRDDADLQAMTLDDFMIEPQVKELPDNQFVAGGDLWTEAD
jgi:predicted amidophosphoribosyltransferase